MDTVKHNPYRVLTRADLSRKQFLPCATDEAYLESGKRDAAYLMRRARDFTETLCDVCDYGAGDGRVARFVEARLLTLVDVLPEVLDLARDTLQGRPGVSFALAKDFVECARYDLIYALQVMQHNTPAEQTAIIAAVRRALKPSGIACLHLPALYPRYKPKDTCVCFTREDVEALAGSFDWFVIDADGPPASTRLGFCLWAR